LEEGIRMDTREIDWGYRVDAAISGKGPMEVPCKYGDEPAGSGAKDLGSLVYKL
jgi:hypothetical protein